MSVIQILNAVFIDVFGDPDIRLYPEMTANDVDGWDSLSHINLIIAVETKFGIRFAQKEIRSFKNVGELLRCVENKLK
jgi:acyl carrier protein